MTSGNHIESKGVFTLIRQAWSRATKMDPIAVRMLEDTYVSVSLKSRFGGI